MAQGEVLAEMVLQGEKQFISGIDSAGDEMEETGGSAGILAGALGRMGEQISDAVVPTALLGSRLDKAGDEASEAGVKAGGAAVGFGALRLSTSGAALSLGMLTTVGSSTLLVLGSLAIAAAAAAVALTPIILGAAALAGAFALIVGSGIFAGMEELKTAFQDVRAQIEPMVKEFGQQFVPFLKETIGMLPDLASRIFDAIGPMDQFLGALRDLRDTAFELLPQFISWFMELGRWALPILRDLGGWIINSLVPAFQQFINIGKDMSSEFGRLSTAVDDFWTGLQPFLAELGPLISELLRLGGIIAYVALTLGGKLLPILAPLVGWITDSIQRFNDLVTSIGGVQSSTNNLSPRLKNLKNELITLWNNLQPLINTLMDIGKRVFPYVVDSINVVKDTLIDLGLIALNVINGDFGEARDIFIRIHRRILDFAKKWGGKLLSWLRNTLVPKAVDWFGELGDKAKNKVQNALDDLISWLKNDAVSDMKSAASSLGSTLADALINAFNDVMPDSVPIPEATIDNPIPGEGDFSIGGGSLPLPQLASGGLIEGDGLAMLHAGERVVPAAQVDRGGGGGGGPQQVVVKLDADAVQDMLRGEAVDVFDSKVQDTERKKRRRGAR